MKIRIIAALAILAATAMPAMAQDGGTQERINLRVSTSVDGGMVRIDRGSSSGLREGDTVTFYPREGSPYAGTVINLNERDAMVRLQDPSLLPPVGTRGEAVIPAGRGDVEAPPPVVVTEEGQGGVKTGEETDPGQTDETLPWQDKDEEYTPDMPLLAEVKAVRPEERAMQMSGRTYLIGDFTKSSSDRSDSFLRAGVDVLYENLFGKGGGLHFDGEYNYRTTELPDEELQEDEDEGNLRIDRISYYSGGTRFTRERWEAGRFLQTGMPEFGVLDGLEWGRRRENGDRFGFSFGYMPEPDEDYGTGDDFQIGGYYLWEPRPNLSFHNGYQLSRNDGASDRNLLVSKLRWMPPKGWTVDASTWIDFDDAGNVGKTASTEITQAYISANRQWDSGEGLNLTYSRMRFPDLQRQEFLPPEPNEIAANRNDRIAASGWRWVDYRKRVHGRVSLWDDEDDSGGDAALGIDIQDLFIDRSQTDLTFFTTEGQFLSTAGARISFRKDQDYSFWSLSYEISTNDREGFDNDSDDIMQHRFRASGGLYRASGWSLSAYGQTVFGDEEDAITIGLYLERSF